MKPVTQLSDWKFGLATQQVIYIAKDLKQTPNYIRDLLGLPHHQGL